MLGLRGVLAVSSRPALRPEIRAVFYEITARVPLSGDIVYESAHMDGGANVLGSSSAYFAGQVALKLQVETFLVDYALAPERPSPDAFDDTRAPLDRPRIKPDRVALFGNAAGGSLALLALLQAGGSNPQVPPGVAFSPCIDVSLSWEVMEMRGSADLSLSRETLASAAQMRLNSGQLSS